MRDGRGERRPAAATGRELSVADSFRLRPVLDVAQRHLDSATVRLQKTAARRDDAQARLDQLRGFLETYRNEYAQAMERGVEPVRLRDFQAFLGKLERAIEMQGAEVTRCQSDWDVEHEKWLALRARQQAFSVLEKRHDLQQAVREGRREQKQQDEFALRVGPVGERER